MTTTEKLNVAIIIPALDEEQSVSIVVRRCLEQQLHPHSLRVVVCDNASQDATAAAARSAGAEVVTTRSRGYGTACLAGIDALGGWPDVIVFVDADGSSRPEEISRLLGPIEQDRADLVIGVRPCTAAMTRPQRWGNRLAVRLIAWRWGHRFVDLGPFRAIRRVGYEKLGMKDRTWGWTVEMQILALRNHLNIEEVPVSWDPRIAGVSKISGTVIGVLRAGTRILWTIGKYSIY